MNLNKRLVVLMTAVFATFIGSLAVSESPFTVEEWNYVEEDVYVSCLGEFVDGEFWVTYKYREFETPSGVTHYVEHFSWYSEYTGQDTGRIWVGKGVSPGAFHTGPEGVPDIGQFTNHEVAKLVVGKGPKIRNYARLKFTVNANGELKVYVEPPVDFSDWLSCVGKGD